MRSAQIRRKPRHGEPAWDIATLFPEQGNWSEEEYLALTTNRLVEFDSGFVEVLPLPTDLHQAILLYLVRLLCNFTDAGQLGTVRTAGLRVRLWPGKIREPDIVFMLAKHAKRRGNRCWKGADLAMEIVSDDPEDRHRDLVEKRREYARAGIAEYWIVDPKEAKITVLKLSGSKYAVAGEYSRKGKAKSVLLKGFEVDVAAALAAE